MQNSKAANPYPNDCIAVFIFMPLFWPLLPMNSTEQSSLFVRLLLDRADLIPRAANGVHNSLRVQLRFREDHGLVFASGRTHLFDRAGFAHSVIDMSLAHPAHHSVDFHCVLPHVLSLLLDFWIIELRGPDG